MTLRVVFYSVFFSLFFSSFSPSLFETALSVSGLRSNIQKLALSHVCNIINQASI